MHLCAKIKLSQQAVKQWIIDQTSLVQPSSSIDDAHVPIQLPWPKYHYKTCKYVIAINRKFMLISTMYCILYFRLRRSFIRTMLQHYFTIRPSIITSIINIIEIHNLDNKSVHLNDTAHTADSTTNIFNILPRTVVHHYRFYIKIESTMDITNFE